MEYRDRENLIDRILVGFSFFVNEDVIFKICSPNRFNYHMAELYKWQIYENNKYDSWLSKTQIEFLLFRLGQLPQDYSEQIKQNRVKIDNLKVQIYEQRFSESKRELIRKNIRQLETVINIYDQKINQFMPLTLDGYSNLCKSDYIIFETVLDINNNHVINENCEFFNFVNLINFINENDLSVKNYRELARTEPWRSYWYCNKENPFGTPLSEWTEQQKNLVTFSRMYDGVFENSECPTDDVINDDDRLDGWFIFQNRKAREERNNSETEKVLGKGKNSKFYESRSKADEVYIVANSKDEVKYIEDLNDPTSKVIKKQRNELIKKKGKVKEYELPDRQMQIRMQAMEKFKEHVKRGKK